MPIKSWKTTMSGVMAIILGGWSIAQPIINGQQASPGETQGALAAILAGIGLLAAKDSNVTGGTKQQ